MQQNNHDDEISQLEAQDKRNAERRAELLRAKAEADRAEAEATRQKNLKPIVRDEIAKVERAAKASRQADDALNKTLATISGLAAANEAARVRYEQQYRDSQQAIGNAGGTPAEVQAAKESYPEIAPREFVYVEHNALNHRWNDVVFWDFKDKAPGNGLNEYNAARQLLVLFKKK